MTNTPIPDCRKQANSYEYKGLRAAVKDIDSSKKRVTGYFSTTGVWDDTADMIMPGAYRKTLKENGPESKQPRILHLLMHDPYQVLGKPEVLVEDEKGLYFETQFPDTQLANDTIKLYEAGIYSEHSIGFQTVKSKWLEGETNDAGLPKREILEVKLWEGSTVTWGANSNTPFLGFKSFSPNKEDELALLAEKISRIDNLLHSNESISDECGLQLTLLTAQLKSYLDALTAAEEPGAPTPLVADEPREDELKALLMIRDALKP